MEVDPSQMPEPEDVDGYVRRGYVFYSRHMYKEAETDFRNAVSLNPEAVDAIYALGMTLKAQREDDAAIKAFQRAIELLEAGVVEGKSRTEMLRRLALGHINEITQGNWNLEKEIWQKAE